MTDRPHSWRELFTTGGLAVAVLIGGTALQAMEGFIASAMLPTVVKDIGGLEMFAWNTTMFIVASILATLFAAVRPASIGPRAGYIIAAAGFGLGSLICGLAPAMPVLLAGRFVQGFGGGLIIAQSLAMLRIVFPQRLWPRAMALNAAIWGIATLLGPAVGGSFAEFGQWRWAFLVIVPAAVLLAFGAWRVLPATSEATPVARLPIQANLPCHRGGARNLDRKLAHECARHRRGIGDAAAPSACFCSVWRTPIRAPGCCRLAPSR